MASNQNLRNWFYQIQRDSNEHEPVHQQQQFQQVNNLNNQNNVDQLNSNDLTNDNDLVNRISVSHPLDFNSYGEFEIFENNSLKIYIQKVTHQRQKRFKLQDSLFKIKIVQKLPNGQHLYLKDLLEVFESAFKFILNNVRSYFDASNHHVAYLTLHQDPMINGLNTGNDIKLSLLLFL